MSSHEPTVKELFQDGRAIDDALREAARDARRLHKALGNPMATWKDGQVVWVQPEDIQVDDEGLRQDEAGQARERLRADVQAGFDALAPGEGSAADGATGRKLAAQIKGGWESPREALLRGRRPSPGRRGKMGYAGHHPVARRYFGGPWGPLGRCAPTVARGDCG